MGDDRAGLHAQARAGDGEITSARSGYASGLQVHGMTSDLVFYTRDGILVYKLGYRARTGERAAMIKWLREMLVP
jgi:hypothetical protein